MKVKPILIFGYGNPSRGDDAVGPFIIEALNQTQFQPYQSRFDALTDFQLQIEHVTDLVDREAVIFVDAQTGLNQPIQFIKIEPLPDHSYTSHAMTPQTLLSVYQDVYHLSAPDTYLLTVTAQQFELGAELSPECRSGITNALDHLVTIFSTQNPENWEQFLI